MLETLEKVDTLVVDKTGTLTEGRPKLTEIVPADVVHRGRLLRLAAAVEQHSEHPLGRRIVDAADERGLTLARGRPISNRSPAAASRDGRRPARADRQAGLLQHGQRDLDRLSDISIANRQRATQLQTRRAAR